MYLLCVLHLNLIRMRLLRVLMQVMLSVDGLERGRGRLKVLEGDEGVGLVWHQLNFFDLPERREHLEKFFVGSSRHEPGIASEKKLEKVH